MASITAAGHHALRQGRVSLVGQVYLLTTVAMDRKPLFADFVLGVAACRALHSTASDVGLDLLCWVLMPDHLHLLARLADGDLSRAVGYLKARIAHAVNDERGIAKQVWSRGFHDHAVRRDQDLLAMARYVVANPVRAGIAASARAYPFWDASWL